MSDAFWKKVIERALKRSTGAQSVDDLDVIQPIWGGNGEVIRAELSGASVPSVVVKKIAVPSAKKKRSDVSTQRTIASYDNELLFYESHVPHVPATIRVARLFAGQRLAEGWLFILEDLTLDDFRSTTPFLTKTQLRAALAWLAGFHAHFLGSEGEGLWKAGSYWNLAARKEEWGKMRDPRLKAAAGALDAALGGSRYKTVIHGDAKTDNFCFSADRSAGIDFQHTGLGCGMKDVMCLFDSGLSRFEVVREAPFLLDFYFEQLRRSLSESALASESEALEAEWRALYPLAWADYYRFLDGWAPGKYPPEGYAEQMTQQALSFLARR